VWWANTQCPFVRTGKTPLSLVIKTTLHQLNDTAGTHTTTPQWYQCNINDMLMQLDTRRQATSMIPISQMCHQQDSCRKPYATPDFPPLIKDRLNDLCPFKVTSVDSTGALYVRSSSGEQKDFYAYSPMQYPAIYLEIVVDLSLQYFLQTFRKFANRRSLPRLMLLDNASDYQATAEELKEVVHICSTNRRTSQTSY